VNHWFVVYPMDFVMPLELLQRAVEPFAAMSVTCEGGALCFWTGSEARLVRAYAPGTWRTATEVDEPKRGAL
jgi:hypothetical protein